MTVAAAALDGNQVAFWSIALAVGGVVIGVVIACLTLLLLSVRDIDTGVDSLWQTATQLASNTATTWQLSATASTLRAVRDELRSHEELLSRR